MQTTVIIDYSPLRREVFVFDLVASWSDGPRIQLTQYVDQERESTRHKFRTFQNRHYEHMADWRSAKFNVEDVPLTAAVADQARDNFAAAVKSLGITLFVRGPGGSQQKTIWQNNTTVI